jgi:hypothetical protein
MIVELYSVLLVAGATVLKIVPISIALGIGLVTVGKIALLRTAASGRG